MLLKRLFRFLLAFVASWLKKPDPYKVPAQKIVKMEATEPETRIRTVPRYGLPVFMQGSHIPARTLNQRQRRKKERQTGRITARKKK